MEVLEYFRERDLSIEHKKWKQNREKWFFPKKVRSTDLPISILSLLLSLLFAVAAYFLTRNSKREESEFEN